MNNIRELFTTLSIQNVIFMPQVRLMLQFPTENDNLKKLRAKERRQREKRTQNI